MSKTITKIGPADHGRRMSLEEFDQAEGQEGHLYELSRGIVTVSDIPGRRHLLLVNGINQQFWAHKITNPGQIEVIAAGSDCKLLIAGLVSERHPDVAVYKKPPPDTDISFEIWTGWVPEILVEVVSSSSRTRDYEEQPEEYLQFGVKEYWIVDGDERTMIVMRRSRGRWVETTVRPPAIYWTKPLPGLEFSIDAVFKAAGLA